MPYKSSCIHQISTLHGSVHLAHIFKTSDFCKSLKSQKFPVQDMWCSIHCNKHILTTQTLHALTMPSQSLEQCPHWTGPPEIQPLGQWVCRLHPVWTAGATAESGPRLFLLLHTCSDRIATCLLSRCHSKLLASEHVSEAEGRETSH